MKKIVFYFDPTITKVFTRISTDSGETRVQLSTPHNFVARAELVARIITIDDDDQIATRIDPGYTYYKVAGFKTLKSGEGIYFDEVAGAYKASAYGFVIYYRGTLKLVPVHSVTRDKLKVYFNVFPTERKKLPTASEIQEYLHEYKILTGIGEKRINDQLSKVNVDEPKLTRMLVAQGKAPIHGQEEYFNPLVEFEKKAGELRSDGRIDFREVGAVVQVFKGQEILERIPPVKAEDGMDVYGNLVPAEMAQPEGYKRGENIVQSGSDENLFLAGIDGVLKIVQRKVSVHETVVINGDVDYETGNIEFNGSVEVTGSVLPGFHIKAHGDVRIMNSIEDAIIEAGGDVTIGMGAVGKEAVKIQCEGNLKTKYLLNATVEAGGTIEVEDSIINSSVFSNKRVIVTGKSGKVAGGEITALYSIEAKILGAKTETTTILSVGRNLYIEKELDEVRKEINVWRGEVTEVIRKLKTTFGEGVFEDPKKYIAILPPVKKKNCLALLQELNKGNKHLKELQDKGQQISEKLKLDEEPYIVAYDRVYPGATLNIKKRIRKIDRLYENARFFEDLETRDIRFTSAV